MTGVFVRQRRGRFRHKETEGNQHGKTGRNWNDAATSQPMSVLQCLGLTAPPEMK